MKTNERYIMQLFAAETNTITAADLEPAITIDHTQKLVDGITTLQRVLGIVDLTPMNVGTTVKQYKYEKTASPDQVGEGETIGLTKYTRKLVNSFELTLEKYRKRTTGEAIQKVGKDKAINDTDVLLEREIQSAIKEKFFTSLAGGTGTVAARTRNKLDSLQKVLAGTWGAMSSYYKDKNVSAVYFVNPLDIADYLANANVTVQTAFGFQYIENFLSLGTVVIDPSVPEGTVYGTVKENLNGVYVPSSGDVSTTFGFTFDSTGMVGMKHYLADDALSIDTVLVSGAMFYAEDLSGIFKATIATAA